MSRRHLLSAHVHGSRFGPALFVSLLLLVNLQRIIAQENPSSPSFDFDHDIRPLFAKACLRCHGQNEPQGELDLTEPNPDVIRVLSVDSPSESLLLERVSAASAADRMPPEGEPLTASEIEQLRRWIESGAPWPEHWSYQALAPRAAPHFPATQQAWAINAIDAFVLAQQEARGLSPNPPAPHQKLIRRLSYDLHGLPPAPEEIDDFVRDTRPDAVSRLVDRMLASPRYGEREARRWMDLVHFAETHGHDQDRPRENAWPYRDYLIDRFNADIDFGQFVQEQVAGDLLAPEDPWSIVGTGFLAAGPWDESSLRDIREDAPDREVARYLDRDDIVTSVMSTFVATSVHCARCHDHKFDPISQTDYYGVQAIFASTDKAERTLDLDPLISRRRRELVEHQTLWQARLQESLAGTSASTTAAIDWIDSQIVRDSRDAWREERDRWVILDAKPTSPQGTQFTPLADGSWRAEGQRPETDVYVFEFTSSLPRLAAIRIEALADEQAPMRGPGRQDNGNLHLSELVLSEIDTAETIPFVSATADFDQQGWTAAHAIDGRAETAWGIFPQVGTDHQLTAVLAQPRDLQPSSLLRLELRQLHGGGHLLARVRVCVSQQSETSHINETPPPPRVAAALEASEDSLSDRDRALITSWSRSRQIERELGALPPQNRVYCGTHHFNADGSFRPSPTPRPVHVLERGLMDRPIATALPSALSELKEVSFQLPETLQEDEGQRRLALARWLTDPRQPLTWRVMANRVWLARFSKGIVATPNDFGRMGAAPSHPELLDFLAAELRDHQSTKRVQRKILTSATYLQDSGWRADAALQDAEATWLWRRVPQRLDAESFRDTLTEVAGMMDWKMGGPSVRQFVQSPGIHVTPIVDYASLPIEDPGLRRRSIYRFVFRTIPDPLLDALDCPDASQLTPQRNVSLTAVQALATLNDRWTVYAAERLAERLEHETLDSQARIERLFRLVLGRLPTVDEARMISDYADRFGWTRACRILFASNEMAFVD